MFLFYSLILLNILFIICILFIYYLLNNLSELSWKLFYIFLSYILNFIIILSFFDEKIFFYLEYIGKYIVIKDPQEYIYILYDFTFLLSFILILPNIIWNVYIFILEMYNKEDYYYIKIIFLNYLYLFFIFQWLFIEDFLFYHWEIFLSKKRLLFDFQGDFYFLYFFYKKEYIELSILLFLFITFLLIFHIEYFKELLNNYIFKNIIINIIIFIELLYFFGGENIYRDFFILCFSIIFGELYIFLILFLIQIKKWKYITFKK